MTGTAAGGRLLGRRSASEPRRRLFHGWRLVGAGATIQAFQSALLTQAFGNYAVLLERQFGWSKTSFSLAFSLMRAESGLLGPVQGWALDRYGTRRIMQLGVVVMAAGMLGLSQIQELWHFFVAMGLAAVGASLSGFLSITSATVRWFERHRAKALSLSGTGFAIGGIVTPGVVWVLRTFGWRWTAALSALIILVVALPLCSLFGPTPEDRGEFVDGIDPRDLPPDRIRAEGVSDVHFTARQAIRTRAFWMISLGHGTALLVVGAVIAHLALYLTNEQGFTLQQASFVGGAMPLLQFVGQIGGGVLGDRVNKRLLASVAMIGHMVGLLLLTYATARWMIWLFVPFHGLAWGVRGPLMQALRADYFGSTAFAQIMGVSSLIVMMGMMGGPLVAGILADQTGSYQLGFTVLAILAGLGMVFFILASPPTPPASQTDSTATDPARADGRGSPS
ncbi:MAG: MFS transporter [Actinomycetota bacterium]